MARLTPTPGGQATATTPVARDIYWDMYPLPVRAFGEAEIDVRDTLVGLVTTADQVRYLLRGYAHDVYAVTNRDLEKDKVASKAYANAVEAQLVAQIDSITRRLLSVLAPNPDKLTELKGVWTQQLQQLAS